MEPCFQILLQREGKKTRLPKLGVVKWRRIRTSIYEIQLGPPSELLQRAMKPPKTKLMMALNFITMLMAGPLVSLSGSPTVSPVTAFLCCSDPLVPVASMYFFALSQAPPVLLMLIAICTHETKAPVNKPAVQFFPKATPHTNGESITKRPGAIISLSEALVEILMHR